MDNKQKRRFFKLLFKIVNITLIFIIGFSLYLSINAIHQGLTSYIWFDVLLIFINFVLAFLLLINARLTQKIKKNKYILAIFSIYLISAITIVFGTIWAFNYFGKISMSVINLLTIKFLIINVIGYIISFSVGLKLSKLNQNTTITIDSVSETPNYDDELLLKKKLDELNRKLEIKKVQEQIAKVESELDENS